MSPSAPEPTAVAPPRRRRSLARTLLNLALGTVLVVVILLEVAYLARRPLFERWLCREGARFAAQALGGEVEIGGIAGDWITTLRVEGVRVRNGEILRELEGGAIEVQIDPLRLARGDLAGIRRARVRATSVDAALPPVPESEETSTSSGPPDLSPWVSFLPEGAEVDIEALDLRWLGDPLSGSVRVHVAPDRPGRERRFAAAALGVTADGAMQRNGEISATVHTADGAKITHFFAPEAPLVGGRVEATTTLDLAPSLVCKARARVDTLQIADRTITHAKLAGRYDDDGLYVADLDLLAPGVRALAHDARLPLVEPFLPTSGDMTLVVDDVTPYAAALPDVVRDQLPITGRLRARVLDSLLVVDDGHVHTAAVSVTIHAGQLALRDRSLAAPLRFDALLLDAARLPLPADLPLQPQSAVVYGSLARRDERLVLQAQVELAARDQEQRRLTAQGSAMFALQPLGEASCDLVLSGDALPLAAPTRVRGAVTWTDTQLRLDDVHVAQSGKDLATLAGTIPLAGDLETLVRDTDFAARFDELDLTPVLQFVNVPDVGIVLRGPVSLAQGKLAVDLAGTVAAYGERTTFTAKATYGDDVARVEQVRVGDAHGGSAALRGTLGLRDGFDWRTALRTAANLELDLEDFDPTRFLPAVEGRPTPSALVSGEVVWKTAGDLDLRATLHATGSVAAGPERAAPEQADAELSLRADADKSTLESLRVRFGPAGLHGDGEVSWSPLALLTGGGVPNDATTRLDVAFDAMTLETLRTWTGIELPLDELLGTLSGEAHVKGSIAAPDMSATLQLSDGRLRLTGGERLDALSAKVSLTPTTLRVDEFSATRGKGPITLTGEVTAPGPWWTSWAQAQVKLTLDGDNVLVHRRAGVKVRADLDLEVKGPLSDLAVTGKIGLRDSKLVTRIPLFDLRRTGGDSTSRGISIPGVELPDPLHVRFDVEVVTLQPFEVETNVLEGKLDVQLALLGALAAPRLQGTVSGPDASVILPGVRLRASTLLVQFTAAASEYPTITMNARGRRHGFDIQVNARGRYDHPDIVFSSDPVLPADELVVLITTGARPAALRSTTGVGTVLGAYVAQEFADWVFGSESTEAKESFLDRFTIETGTEMSRGGNESIVVEFRVGDRTYLQGERDVYEDINMGIVYRIRFR